MILLEKEIHIPPAKNNVTLLEHFQKEVEGVLGIDEVPIRFAVVESNADGFKCEISVIKDADEEKIKTSIFDFVPKDSSNTDNFNAIMLVPTGIGAEIGGHAVDATPAARLLAGICDRLIIHPNVVNASDINEMPENSLYVEGSVIARLLMGTVGLQEVQANRVLFVIDEHEDEKLSDVSINAASAARATLGMNVPEVVKMKNPIKLLAGYTSSGNAVGEVEGLERLIAVIRKHKSKVDAVALATKIDVDRKLATKYFYSKGEMVNPWGGVEAMLTHSISSIFNLPSAHAPMAANIEDVSEVFGIVDARMSAEAISTAFVHCVFKGLHKSPRIITDRKSFTRSSVMTAEDISCLIIPDGCIGIPTLAAIEQGIPVIAVTENKNRMKNDLSKYPFTQDKLYIVSSYLEAAGVMLALKNGVSVSSVKRPLANTNVMQEV
jgi:hypothetical protein